MSDLQFSPSSDPYTRPSWVAGTVVTVYEDAAGTVLADISLTDGGAPISGSTLTVTSTRGEVPVFYGRDPFVDTLYLSAGGAFVPIRSTTRLDPYPSLSTELGYASRTTNDTTTNTAYASAPSNKISGLSVTVVGEGLPVKIEFRTQITHSVAAARVNAVLLINGSVTGGQLASVSSPDTASGRDLMLTHRMLLTAGTSYTFEIGKYVSSAGTGTYVGGADFPMYLSVSR